MTTWTTYNPTWHTTYRAGCDRWASVHLDSLHRWQWVVLTDDGEMERGVADSREAAQAAAEAAAGAGDDGGNHADR